MFDAVCFKKMGFFDLFSKTLVQADLQSAVVEYQDLQSDYACLICRQGLAPPAYHFAGRGWHRLPIIRRHSVTLPAAGVDAHIVMFVYLLEPVQADLQSAVVEYQDLQSDCACLILFCTPLIIPNLANFSISIFTPAVSKCTLAFLLESMAVLE